MNLRVIVLRRRRALTPTAGGAKHRHGAGLANRIASDLSFFLLQAPLYPSRDKPDDRLVEPGLAFRRSSNTA
jgi:hypothetical protein